MIKVDDVDYQSIPDGSPGKFARKWWKHTINAWHITKPTRAWVAHWMQKLISEADYPSKFWG